MRRRTDTLFVPSSVAVALTLIASSARADLATDLAGAEAQAGGLAATLAVVSGPIGGLCGDLVSANQQARDLAAELTRIDGDLAAPLTVDASVLDALERLSVATVGLAGEAARLSTDLQAQQTALDALSLRDSIAALLQLSADIGVMADRIGEMSDKILVMSDDIGAMADRILVTQQLQSENLQTTQATLLATQDNSLALLQVIEDATYGLSFAGLATEGAALAAALQSVRLRPWTVASSLSDAAAQVRTFASDIEALQASLDAAGDGSTLSVSATALAQLMDLSAALGGLSVALDGYVLAVSGLQAFTSTPSLLDALRSILQLSADIGLMADRINEMGDQILAMSDNIGLQADQLVLTQQTLGAGFVSSQASVLAAQQMAVALIAARSL